MQPPSQMNKPPPPPPPAQMLQQHSPIAIATQHPQTTAVVNSGLTTKDFLPSLQHSHVRTLEFYLESELVAKGVFYGIKILLKIAHCLFIFGAALCW